MPSKSVSKSPRKVVKKSVAKKTVVKSPRKVVKKSVAKSPRRVVKKKSVSKSPRRVVNKKSVKNSRKYRLDSSNGSIRRALNVLAESIANHMPGKAVKKCVRHFGSTILMYFEGKDFSKSLNFPDTRRVILPVSGISIRDAGTFSIATGPFSSWFFGKTSSEFLYLDILIEDEESLEEYLEIYARDRSGYPGKDIEDDCGIYSRNRERMEGFIKARKALMTDTDDIYQRYYQSYIRSMSKMGGALERNEKIAHKNAEISTKMEVEEAKKKFYDTYY